MLLYYTSIGNKVGNFLVAKLVRIPGFYCRELSSTPGQGTEIPQTTQ